MTSLAAKLKYPLTEFRDWKRFSPNVEVHFEARDFTVKTVSSMREWYQVLRFRREVFLKEYGVTQIVPFGLDMDRYDWKCDQLVVQNKTTGDLIGCYRILCSEFTNSFYSEQEFELDHVKRLPGIKVELGRACVHPDFRNGVVMQLLWRGIADYIRQVGASYAFGCTSLKTTDPVLTRKMELILSQRQALVSWPFVTVKKPFQFTAAERMEQARVLMVEDEERTAIEKEFPPLLKILSAHRRQTLRHGRY
ncbi:MAG: GNAT family N-acetyltransferase [Bdellovibrionaceae bacterium]|nr:GNAT family N-acetyltransferase [Pseudobdellovibrionaceae bacterium]